MQKADLDTIMQESASVLAQAKSVYHTVKPANPEEYEVQAQMCADMARSTQSVIDYYEIELDGLKKKAREIQDQKDDIGIAMRPYVAMKKELDVYEKRNMNAFWSLKREQSSYRQ